MVGLTSAAGLVGYLSEPDPALQTFALQQLDQDIDLLWTEVAGSIGQMLVFPCCSSVEITEFSNESFPIMLSDVHRARLREIDLSVRIKLANVPI